MEIIIGNITLVIRLSTPLPKGEKNGDSNWLQCVFVRWRVQYNEKNNILKGALRFQEPTLMSETIKLLPITL